jgi:hypothetical protein
VTVAANDPGLEDTLGDVTRWFFDDYLSRWQAVANGTDPEGPEFILDYSRRAGQTELERLAVHFQAVRNADGWRAIDIQETGTTVQSLDEIWPIHRGRRLRATERSPS